MTVESMSAKEQKETEEPERKEDSKGREAKGDGGGASAEEELSVSLTDVSFDKEPLFD